MKWKGRSEAGIEAHLKIDSILIFLSIFGFRQVTEVVTPQL